MKKLYFVLILFLAVFSQLDAQIFYNIELPPSYQKAGVIGINNLPSINYNIDFKGNLLRDNLSTNVKDYLKIEEIGGRNIARVKFSIKALSLGEMTLRFSNVRLNNGAHCYVYTSDYEIVAGPVYEKSISNVLNIVKIPAYELILEIVFNSIKDFDLVLNSISFQSLIDISRKNDNSLQEAIPDSNWDCSNCDFGDKDFVDNVGLDTNRKSWFGAGYKEELFTHKNLYSVNDLKLDAARASCMIMTPSGGNYMAYPGTLINFPESQCNGIIISVAHNGDVYNICEFQRRLHLDSLYPNEYSDEQILFYTNYLHNTIIRFNWHHKYGKPLHLIDKCNPTPADFELWRKTIDFDEVIDYCGVIGVAYSNDENGDYAIIRMVQRPFYKELHLGWTTQHDFECHPLGSNNIKNRNDYLILGHHAATPTYVYKSSVTTSFGTTPIQGFSLQVIPYHDDPVANGHFIGWSGSQLLSPEYTRNGSLTTDTTKKIGLGLIREPGNVNNKTLASYNYNYSFEKFYTLIVDPTIDSISCGGINSLYNCYLRHHFNEIDTIGNFYWMPSKENREKCPSTLGGGVAPCEFYIRNVISAIQKDGKLKVIINIGGINIDNFPGDQYPKGIRIYHASGDQETFYFDTFADSIDIPSTIEFIIDQCDLLYYQTMGFSSLKLGFDFYDSQGKILTGEGCNEKYTCLFTKINPCEAISVTYENIMTPPPCCTYKISIKFDGCDDYSNIFRLFLEKSSLINLDTGDTTAISNQTSLITNYDTGEISFTLHICEPMSFKLDKSFGNNYNCGSYNMDLDCPVGPPIIDCCFAFHSNLLPVLECDSNNSFEIISKKFYINFGQLYNGRLVWPQCLFDSAHVVCPNPNLDITEPFYEKTITSPVVRFFMGDLGTFEGSVPGTYCFYCEVHTSNRICYDTICVVYNGTAWEIIPAPPGPIIYIDESNNSNSSDNLLPVSNKLDYEQISIVDINGTVLIESKPIDKIDVSKLQKGSYNVLFRKKGEIIQSQKLIIK